MKLMILDGNSLVNRAFYGVRMLNAPDGTPTNAVYGFLTILQRLFEEERPDALCVAFDVHAPTFRHKRFAGYKEGRRPMPEELRQQIPLLKELLDAMEIPRLELPGWEADDILGTVSRRWEKDWDCVLVSGDRDILQLVDGHVRVLHVKSRLGQTETVDYTPELFREEYGFEPPKLVDLKALMGDASDRIPGVPGVGEKSARELLQRFGSLEEVYAHLEDGSLKPGLAKKLREGRESAELSYELATIVRDAPLSFEPAPWTMPREGALYALLKRLDFRKFIERWGLVSGEDAPAERELPEAAELFTEAELEEGLRALAGAPASLAAEPALEALVFGRGERFFFLCRESFRGDWSAALGRLLSPAVPKEGHGVKELLREALGQGVTGGGFCFDSALAAYLLDAGAGSYELGRLCAKYGCGDLAPEAAAPAEQLSLLEEETAGQRAERRRTLTARAAAVEALEKAMLPRLRDYEMEPLLRDIELPLCPILADMEERGFRVDREALRSFTDSLVGSIAELQEAVWQEAGHEFNINSPKQLGTVLFDELGLPAGKKTKTGWSTSADVLERLRFTAPIVQRVLDFRELSKLKSTYGDGLLKEIGPDGRIHTLFHMTVTATGRLSSAEPNLQNIPVRKEHGALIRRMFVAEEGNILVDADYSQIELRLLAHISGDEQMRRAFLSGEDVHAVTASQVFGIPLSEVTPEERRRAKAVNFGIVYGISAFSLAQDIGVMVSEAKDYMDAYLERFSGVRDYQKNIVEEAREKGWVETVFHRRRWLPELSAPQFPTRAFGERAAMNMPIQGTAADVIKLAMVRVDRRLRQEGLQGRLILQVHDELIVECPEAEREAVAALLEEEMEQAFLCSVPLVAESKWGRNWAEAH